MHVGKITVCGGGNGAQTLVPVAARGLGCPVDVYAPFGDEAERLRRTIRLTGAVEAEAAPHRTSADPAEVIPGSELVMLVLPAYAHEATLRQIVPFLDRGAWVGAMPARGGFDTCAAWVLEENGREDIGILGLQTLPWACRIQEYGRSVHVLGTKDAVDVATRPRSRAGEMASLLARVLGLRIDPAASLMALTLANTGQLIHPGIMYGHFCDWDGTPFPAEDVPRFYHGLDERGARILADLSDDIQRIRSRLEPMMDLSAVRPLQEWLVHSYGDMIDDPASLQSAFVTNRAYEGLMAPVREVGPGAYVPDFGARYLAEDVPFGLVASRAIAELCGVATPMMDEVIGWAGERLGKYYLGRDSREARIPQNYGLGRLEQLIAFAADRTIAECAISPKEERV
jgi:hypothetical protein